ncbi:SIR2 family protein [Cytophagaceae bacterium DM2B3-1]|uniref:NAD(+) hydrolase ThsA n=1 Tax=Xanthocytophaga flava TaxID=3048013 RepID=A0ABT7CXG6_9BACT|nr:SIR2 family protein [Xanthocytophaga flavus]MDJ1498413.1 SIR2 family protein [Xanthocytophaga flavus]
MHKIEFSQEIKSFIKDFVKNIQANDAAIFAGAGLSRKAGYANWAELLAEIAEDLGLDIKKENDLISLAQFHVNKNQNNDKIKRKILEEFSDIEEPTEDHKILAKLPITTYWTTNYDNLIEESLKQEFKKPDVKYTIKQLTTTLPRRSATVYKMHGDVNHPSDAILTKEHFEQYPLKYAPFITALNGDLVAKTFLFIGFSFTDPNLNYVLSRLHFRFDSDARQHYCFVKRVIEKDYESNADFEYSKRKQELTIQDLLRYKIKALLIDDYSDITHILKEIENHYRKKTIFISGSAEVYADMGRETSQKFVHILSKKLIQEGYRIVNGFGWGIGSGIINGALDGIYEKPDKFSEDQLIIRPFPQFPTGKKDISELWEEYRQRMIQLAGISIFLFGNKKDESGNIINANGVKREFEISLEKGLIPIAVGITGYIAKELWNEIKENNIYERFGKNEEIEKLFESLNEKELGTDQLVENIIKLIKLLNK